MATLILRVGDMGDFAWTCPHCGWTVRVATEARRRAERDAHRWNCLGPSWTTT